MDTFGECFEPEDCVTLVGAGDVHNFIACNLCGATIPDNDRPRQLHHDFHELVESLKGTNGKNNV